MSRDLRSCTKLFLKSPVAPLLGSQAAPYSVGNRGVYIHSMAGLGEEEQEEKEVVLLLYYVVRAECGSSLGQNCCHVSEARV